ncbi:MAG: phosphoenolpyruvate--protein phosphotransferase [Phycisphaeraceae bacterium]|nr:phosphoenolpyruvate--protein phosphotransferase [Phycisphaeraceae bacterium]
MQLIKGIPVSPGVVIGRIFALDDERQKIARRAIPAAGVAAELARLDGAIKASIRELELVRDQAEKAMGAEAAKIFHFHIGMLGDKSLIGPMRAMIEKQLVVAEFAVFQTFSEWAARFRAMKDSAFTTKANDLEDLSSRVLRHLIGEHRTRLNELNHQAVVVAPDLTPSQAAGFDRGKVVAFATDLGGRTGHTSIVARALGIPAVVGCGNVTTHATDGTTVIIDGDRGVVIIDPDARQLSEYQAYIEQRKVFQLSLDELAGLESITRDGVEIELLGNIEFPQEIPLVLKCGGEGVGLYRTEFLYLTREEEPTEEEHFAAYSECVRHLAGRTLVIRTMDLGADKYTQRQQEQPERNPFLGLRSIRYCLKNLPMFKTQLRAILRASALGPLKIMFPLVTSTQELRQAKWVLREVMEDLSEEGIAYNPEVDVGMMVEVPSVAVMADTFAREVDFFSIGTNDLVQYTLAVDRTNERVASMFSPAHPAVIKLIKDVARVSRRRGVPLSCCGEAAGDPEYAILLIGLGVRTLSATAASIPPLKRLVRSVTIEECEKIARKALSLDSDVSVAAFLRDQTRKILPEAFDGRSIEERA